MSSSLPHAGDTDDTTRGKCDHDDNFDGPQQQQSPHSAAASPVQLAQPSVCQQQQQQQQQQHARKNKLRVLVITMGGQRQEHIRCMFRALAQDFEEPVFSLGVPSRLLRNRQSFFKICHEAGLIPELEYQAIQQQHAASSSSNQGESDSKNFFSCLDNVPMEHCRRRVGNAADCQIHYSIELWRKAKTINRGRSVLACLLAHLIAMQKFTTSDFDVLLEDNVRVPISSSSSSSSHDNDNDESSICATRIRETIQASREYEQETGTTCHLRYYGWLGSLENLQWIHECHLPKRSFHSSSALSTTTTVAPFPTTQNIENDLLEMKNKQEQPIELLTTAMQAHASILLKNKEKEENHDAKNTAVTNKEQPRPPGGTPVWGAYAYWISKQGYEHVLNELQQDVGSLLWKGKRARYYTVKPIDKILPRKIMAHFGTTALTNSAAAVHITTCPTFFRAPMLTSKIHAKWDAGFCQSTQYQLDKFCNGMTWSDLYLTPFEQLIVQYHQEQGTWLTLDELETMLQQQQQRQKTTSTAVVEATNSNAIWKQDA